MSDRHPSLNVLVPILCLAGMASAQAQAGSEASRRPATVHRLMLMPEDHRLAGLRGHGAIVDEEDYGSFVIAVVDEGRLGGPWALPVFQDVLRDDDGTVGFTGAHLRTDSAVTLARTLDWIPGRLRMGPSGPFSDGRGLFIVHFIGPIREHWLEELRALGGRIVAYIPANAYVVSVDPSGFAGFESFGCSPAVAWTGVYEPWFKLSPALRVRALEPAGVSTVTVQVVAGPDESRFLEVMASLEVRIAASPERIRGFLNLYMHVPDQALAILAAHSSVFAIEPLLPPQPLDEVQARIVTGHLNSSGTALTGPGYLSWLVSKGFNPSQAANFLVDISDDGLDHGGPGSLHADFHLGGVIGAGSDRVIYHRDYLGSAASLASTRGHGTLVASIIGGFNSRNGAAFEDGSGYNFGLGISPFVGLGSSRMLPGPQNYAPPAGRLTDAWNDGARISNNSWGNDCVGYGCSVTSSYSAAAQAHDAFVRDSVPGSGGNQEMTIVFAVGNHGPGTPTDGTIVPPATAKNVIAVGASESLRAGHDGCYGAERADDADDLFAASSQGPTLDGRRRPDLVAPGTHVQGAATQGGVFTGDGLCPTSPSCLPTSASQSIPPPYHPCGETLYTWSSGTSFAAPVVSGAAALLRQHFMNQGWTAPSPAMTKASLMGTAHFMTGNGAGAARWSNAQGMGRLDLARLFDGTPSYRHDQSHVFDSSGETWQITGTIARTDRPFRVALAWTDKEGAINANAWVNDLDLEVLVGSSLYKGNVFAGEHATTGGSADGKNNAEFVFLPVGTGGPFQVTVRATNVAGDGVPGAGDETDQDFALLIYNALTGTDFALIATPSSGSLSEGGQISFTISNVAEGISGPIALTLPATVPHVTWTPASPAVAANGTIQITATADASIPVNAFGTYGGTVVGQSGAISRSVTVDLTLVAPNAPPAITSHPSGPAQPLCVAPGVPGATFSFTVVATGPDLQYRWLKDGSQLGPPTFSPTLTIPGVTAGDAGSYQVVVFNPSGAVTSQAAILAVNVAPVISSHPSSQTVPAGTPVAFTVVVSGIPAPTFQWLKDDVAIGGATAATYSIPAAAPGDAGTYKVRLNNGCGAPVDSDAAVLVVLAPSGAGEAPSPAAMIFQQIGISAGDRFGHNVAPAGDADGDGYSDLAVSAFAEDLINIDSGSVRVYSGRTQQAIFTSGGLPGNTRYGRALANAGDLNGDGRDDLLIGAPGSDPQRVFAWSVATNTLLHLLTSPGSNLGFGISMSRIGDLSGDGRPEFVVGASGADAAYVFDGALGVQRGAPVTGQAGDAFGISVAGVGDVNGDGIPDFAVGAEIQNLLGTGYVRVFSGASGHPVLYTVPAPAPVAIAFGRNLAALGDINGDGRPEIGVGTSFSGQVWIFTLHPTTATHLHTFSRTAGGTASVAGGSDFNQDGFPDILCGFPGDRSACVFSGPSGALLFRFSTDDLGTGNLGADVAFPGDMNADGRPEVAAGAPDADPAGPYAAGVVRVFSAGPACFGSPFTFTLGNAPAGNAYQWRRNGDALPGAMAPSLTIPSLILDHSGTYDVFVQAGTTSSYTLAASINVVATPVITLQPGPPALSVCAGDPVLYSVGASGLGALTYQWQRNGADLPAETAPVLSLPAVTAAQAGSYRVLVRNGCLPGTGTAVASSIAVLSVNDTPVVQQQPSPTTQIICPGASVSYSVVASAATPSCLTYQWRRDGVILVDGPVPPGPVPPAGPGTVSGAMTATLTLADVTAGSFDGTYDVVVGLGAPCSSPCVATSQPVTLSITSDVVITSSPASASACPGQSVSFSVEASGAGPFSYQWRRDGLMLANGIGPFGVAIAGATEPTLTLGTLDPGFAGPFDVVVTGPCGSAISPSATLTFGTPAIVSAPQSQAACGGTTATFAATASGTGPLSYQWQKAPAAAGPWSNMSNGSSGTGATYGGTATEVLTVTGVQPGDAGWFRMVVSSPCGSTPSAPARLTVGAPLVTVHPQPETLVWQWEGGAPDDKFGQVVLGIGDVDGDQHDDVAVSAIAEDFGGISDRGSVRVFSGRTGGVLFQSGGSTMNTRFGAAMADAGDLDGDGRNDLLVGAPGADPQKVRAYSVPTGSLIFELDPPFAPGSGFGYALARLGNITGDVRPEFLVGSPKSESVQVYTWNGMTVDQTGPTLTGQPGDTFGVAVAGVGDLDADGFPDFAVGAEREDLLTTGTVRLFSGASGFPALYTIPAPGPTALAFGRTVSPLGDVNGDGRPEIGVGSWAVGQVWVYTLHATTATLLHTFSGTSQANGSVAATGDVDADGRPDIMVGLATNGAAIFSGATGALLLKFSADSQGLGSFGSIVADAGDLNADGIADFVIGGPSFPSPTAEGLVRVLSVPARCAGQQFQMSVAASGTNAFTYQWRKNGSSIGGATGPIFGFAALSLADAGVYDCVITGQGGNYCGSVVSEEAAFRVVNSNLPTFLPAPVLNQSASLCTTGIMAATLSVPISGAGLSFVWKKNDATYAFTPSAMLDLSSVQPQAIPGDYTLTVSQGSCSVTTPPLQITVPSAAPIITSPPDDQCICLGANVSWSVGVAAGSGTVTYQWSKGGLPIPGATAATLTIPAAGAGDVGNYSVEVRNGCGPTTSPSAQLALRPVPGFTTQPVSQTVSSGTSVTFQAVVDQFPTALCGALSLTWQWRQNGIDIPGASGTTSLSPATITHTIPLAAPIDAGVYALAVSSTCGTVLSSLAVLTVQGPGLVPPPGGCQGPPAIILQPQALTRAFGAPAAFLVAASGMPPFHYQWRLNGVPLAGPTTTSAFLSIPFVTPQHAGPYDVVVTDVCGATLSASAFLEVVSLELGLFQELNQTGHPVTIFNSHLEHGRGYVNLFSIETCPGPPGSGPYLGLCVADPGMLLSQFLTGIALCPPPTPGAAGPAVDPFCFWTPPLPFPGAPQPEHVAIVPFSPVPPGLPSLPVQAVCVEFEGGPFLRWSAVAHLEILP